MLPTTSLMDRMWTLLGQDTLTLAFATQVKVYLVNVPFTPSAAPVIGDLTSPTTGGLGPISAGTTNLQSTDPNTGDIRLELAVPPGGWNWLTSDTVGLNTTVYGFIVTNSAHTVVYGGELLPEPVTFTAVGQSLNVPTVGYTMPQSAVS